MIKGGQRIFYNIERPFLAAFRKRSFFGVGRIVRENGSLVVIVVIATLIVFGNISTDNSFEDGFLVGYWNSSTDTVAPVIYKSDDSLLLDGDMLSDTQMIVTSAEEKERASEQMQLDILANADQELLGDASIIPPRREGASDPDNEGDVVLYTVQSGDTLSTIAQAHNVTTATLYWANEIDDVDDIKPGDTIFILPISGLKHTVDSGDTIDDIAEEYEVDAQEIIAYNELPANGELKEGDEIIIPGAQKDIPEPEPDPIFALRDYVATGTGSTNLGSSIIGGSTARVAGNSFPYGYCTYYVANRRTVTWRGNAGAWLYNAKAQGYATGKKPKVGAIVVTTEDARYGHVAYVEAVGSDTITVSEMNYKGWGVINQRTLSQNARVIRGYIY